MIEMTTPILDFARQYEKSAALRFHMPGHKGVQRLGFEGLDLTEINGADELYAPEGIIAESEANASRLFGCRTIYSTEGSSLCIRAMLYLAVQYSQRNGKQPLIAAGRNAHRTFLTAAALLDFETVWIPPVHADGILSCVITPESLTAFLEQCRQLPSAIYLTSPDYLGNMADIRRISEVCHRFGVLLLVDNAHGAYLRFLEESQHPIDLGADLCCDSAHKTLPVLTGGAYLHCSEHIADFCKERDKAAMGLFGSTSPSYLILESLDLCNAILENGYRHRLTEFLLILEQCKNSLSDYGWKLTGNEPMKLCISTKSMGYTGKELAEVLEKSGIYPEFADSDFLVLMPSPDTQPTEFEALVSVLLHLPPKNPLQDRMPVFAIPECVISPREAVFSDTQCMPITECTGRICAELSFSCPPAIPIVMCGERISTDAVQAFMYYGIKECTVVKET